MPLSEASDPEETAKLPSNNETYVTNANAQLLITTHQSTNYQKRNSAPGIPTRSKQRAEPRNWAPNDEIGCQARRRWRRQYIGTARHRNNAWRPISSSQNEDCQPKHKQKIRQRVSSNTQEKKAAPKKNQGRSCLPPCSFKSSRPLPFSCPTTAMTSAHARSEIPSDPQEFVCCAK